MKKRFSMKNPIEKVTVGEEGCSKCAFIPMTIMGIIMILS
jgi:hypothetical protein